MPLVPRQPISNRERQRRFRERHPGYYQRLHAKRRAEVKACAEQLQREEAIQRILAPPAQLCLPAPHQVSGRPLLELLQADEAPVPGRAECVPVMRELPGQDGTGR